MATRTLSSITVTLVAAVGCLLASGCSSDDDDNTIDGSGGAGNSSSGGIGNLANGGTGNSSSGGAGNSSSGGTGNSSSGGTGATGVGGLFDGEACHGMPFETGEGGAPDCVGIAQGAEAIPVDMYIMMDRSVSMLETIEGEDPEAGEMTRWDGVKEAMQQFVQHPDAANLGVGIQFFSTSGTGSDTRDCNVSDYATPAVPIGLVSAVGQDIYDAIDATVPAGLTPTHPALEGALQYAAEHFRSAAGGRITMAVLVTDGLPTQCGEQRISEIAALAEQARLEDEVLTFVVGLGAGTWNLEQIALFGGTGAPFIIEEGNVAEQFLNRMLNITQTPLACQFEIPESPNPTEVVDFDMVQFIYTPTNGSPEEVPRVANAAACATATYGGWYYNSSVNPTSIRVCPCTCARFGAGQIEIRLGCEPRTWDIG